MLQTRNGKRTAAAALKIACDLVDEGMIDEKQAVCHDRSPHLDTLLHPQFDAEALKKAAPIGNALAASPGAACGKIVFTAEDAKEWADRGEKVVLVRLETSPEDIEGMKAAQGILTVRGGMTSHAAVVARGMGTCCVSGCGAIDMDEDNKQFTLAGKTFHEGDWLSLDGSTGNIYGERHPHRGRLHRRRVRPDHGLGRQVPPPEGPHQRRHPPRRQARPGTSAPRASACAAPSTCSSRRTASPPSGR